MNVYRVSIWSSIFVEAESIEQAEDVAHDHVIGCLIKPRDFDFDTEIWEGDVEDDLYIEIINYEDFTNKKDQTMPDICPSCNVNYIPNNESPGMYPGALSRKDNKTEICSECGVLEALEDFDRYFERKNENGQ